jgi:acyl carrier protein
METFIKHFINQLDTPPTIEITGDTNFRDLEEWDSLTALSIMAMVDDEYGVNITGDEIKKSNTINDLFEIVNKKG